MDSISILLTVIIAIGSVALLIDVFIDLFRHNKKLDETVVDEMFKNIYASFCTEHDCEPNEVSVVHAPMGRNVICSTLAHGEIVMRIYFYKRKIVITYKNFTFFQFTDRKVFKMKHGIFYLQDIENTIHHWSEEMFGEKPLKDLTQHSVKAAELAIKNYEGSDLDLLLKVWDSLLEKAADSGTKQDLKNLMSLTSYLMYAHKDDFMYYIQELVK